MSPGGKLPGTFTSFKGGGIYGDLGPGDGVMYIQEGMRQLNDVTCYKPVSKTVITESFSMYKGKLVDWRNLGILEWHEFQFLCVIKPRIPSMYLLPTIHKNAVNPPGRPIIASIERKSVVSGKS